MVLQAAVERPVPATVFVNPSAGRGGAGRKIAEVCQEFARRKFLVDLVETASAQEFRASVQARIASGCRTFIAMGGDGTLQLLVREVIGRELQVGVIPAGGGNDFAAALGIQKNVSQAVDVIAAANSGGSTGTLYSSRNKATVISQLRTLSRPARRKTPAIAQRNRSW